MYRLTRPTTANLQALIAMQANRPVLQQTGTIPEPTPPGFRRNTGGSRLGEGPEVFATAREAIRNWQMFPQAWVQVETGHTPVHLGQTVAVTARCLGVWTTNCCRVVDITETDRLFAFTYATTDQHPLSGAERFQLEWREDDTVWFGIDAIARPRDLAVWLGLPALRRMQHRFAREAPLALSRAVADSSAKDRHRARQCEQNS